MGFGVALVQCDDGGWGAFGIVLVARRAGSDILSSSRICYFVLKPQEDRGKETVEERNYVRMSHTPRRHMDSDLHWASSSRVLKVHFILSELLGRNETQPESARLNLICHPETKRLARSIFHIFPFQEMAPLNIFSERRTNSIPLLSSCTCALSLGWEMMGARGSKKRQGYLNDIIQGQKKCCPFTIWI